jgi:hypothetical protein
MTIPEKGRNKICLTIRLTDVERSLLGNVAQIEDRTMTSVLVRGLKLYATEQDYCLNPLDCGSDGTPKTLCITCGEAFRKDMQDKRL